MATRNSIERTGSTGVLAPQAPSPWGRRWRSFTRFLRSKPLGTTGLVLVVIFALLAAFPGVFAPQDPRAFDSSKLLEGPSANHLFGTDFAGRDVLSRVIFGARISIYVGMTSMLIAAVVGSSIGVTSAYFGGKLDLVVQRFVDAFIAFPSLVLALALVALFTASLTNIIIAISIVFTPRLARVIRSVALSIKEIPYIEASRAIGASDARIMLRHVLPNTFASLMVYSTSLVGSAILIEASLSFLGVGMPVGTITWGAQLSGQVLRYFTVAPHIAIFPGFALTLAVFGVNILGDAMRDALDPRLRGR